MISVKPILQFLKTLSENNNREWFADHKDEYLKIQQQFEAITALLIGKIAMFDKTVNYTSPKECTFRIYRDIRFSKDKSPYKLHFGTYMAGKGGRKSPLSAYYLHLQPNESFLVVGVYNPQPEVLKALRRAIYENIDEWNEITNEKDFKSYFKELWTKDNLKKVPIGFPKDFSEKELLKCRHYMYTYPLPDSFFDESKWDEKITDIFRAGYPLNRFLNFTIQEILGI